MTRSGSGIQTLIAAVLVGVLGLITAGVALVAYVTSTPPLHPDPAAVPSTAEATPAPRWADAADRGRRVLRDGLVRQNLPGLSVAVGVEGTLVWAEGLGFADLDRRTPVTPATRFRLGSASTVLTSAAVGLLLEERRLDLDGEIQAYVPEFPRKPWPVTLRQVLGHVAGLRSDGGDEGPLFGRHCARPVEALPAFADGRLLFEPGTRLRHSRYGWIVASAAVEAAARRPFLELMRDRVFEPLGMHDTMADPFPAAEDDAARARPDAAPNRATSYFPRFAADPRYGPDPMRPIDLSCYAGAGAYVSTPSDLVRFGLAVQGGRLLKPETVQLLQSSLRLNSGEETGYGLGWDLDTVTLNGAATPVAGHDGAVLGGSVATFLTVPGRGLVVAVLSNISYADTPALARQVAAAFLAEPLGGSGAGALPHP